MPAILWAMALIFQTVVPAFRYRASFTHISNAGVPSEYLEWHGHNDFYKAVSNSTTAWLYGACGVNCSMFGIETQEYARQ